MIPQDYFNKVKNFFDGDTEKAWIWFQSPNVGLGGITPIEMIKRGRVAKLKSFIDSRLNGYWP
jgi:hypothetical protein